MRWWPEVNISSGCVRQWVFTDSLMDAVDFAAASALV